MIKTNEWFIQQISLTFNTNKNLTFQNKEANKIIIINKHMITTDMIIK